MKTDDVKAAIVRNSNSYRLTEEQAAEVRRRLAEQNPRAISLAELDRRLRRLRSKPRPPI